MRIVLLMLVLACSCFLCQAQLLPDYNSTFYSTVLTAAQGVGQPYLLQQGYSQMPGVTVDPKKPHQLIFQGKTYNVYEKYTNPKPSTVDSYYINKGKYAAYRLNAFLPIWPKSFPNSTYHDDTFKCYIDCVGYGTRLLSATGSADTARNAYTILLHTIRSANTSPFAANGWVASAYEFAVAFPTLPANAAKGWMYMAGGVLPQQVNTYNHKLRKHINTYNGVNRGGFANAQAGDILSFGYPPGGGSNGHFMVMSATPQRLDASSLKALLPASKQSVAIKNLDSLLRVYRIYAVPLYDCSGQDIHFNDSRKLSSGIGHGTLLILTDINTDVPQGFVFGPGNLNNDILNTFKLGNKCYAISVGRFVGF